MTTVVGESKARGAFYTPRPLADFLTRWAVRSPRDRILEPACGDGAFMDAAVRRYRELGRRSLAGLLYGVEVEAEEAAKAQEVAPSASIVTRDFFELNSSEVPAVDAVIGNPPYIRYHGFRGAVRERACERAREQGVEISSLASSWAYFAVYAQAFLKKDGGRLALVLPAELLHTDYAGPVRAWLLRRFGDVTIVTFDRMTFADAEVDALLLLASNDSRQGLRVLRVPDAGALATLDLGERGPNPVTPGMPRVQKPATRWSGALSGTGNDLYADFLARPGVRRLGDIARVDIGVVTGANHFFILDRDDAESRGLMPGVLLPIIENGSAVGGLSVHARDAKRLLSLSEESGKEAAVRAYLKEGQADEVDQGYKCRTRKPWYRVPMPRLRADAFLPYMNYRAPRLLVNIPKAWSTNLLHGVALGDDAPHVKVLSAAMLSAATALSGEIEGRAYGGGVLKFETREAERLAIPAISARAAARLRELFPELDKLVRDGNEEEASARVDRVLGIRHEQFRAAAAAYRDRRLHRGRVGRPAVVAATA